MTSPQLMERRCAGLRGQGYEVMTERSVTVGGRTAPDCRWRAGTTFYEETILVVGGTIYLLETHGTTDGRAVYRRFVSSFVLHGNGAS